MSFNLANLEALYAQSDAVRPAAAGDAAGGARPGAGAGGARPGAGAPAAPAADSLPGAPVLRELSRQDRRLFRGTAVQVHDGMTNANMLQACGASFDVLTAAPSYDFAGVDGVVSRMASDRHRVWYRSDDGQPLGVFGDRRQVVQPSDFLDYFRAFCNQSEKAISLDVVGSLDGGRTFYMGAKLSDDNIARTLRDHPDAGMGIQRLVNADDRTDHWLILTDHYGQSLAPRAVLVSNRLICCNGMTQRVDVKLAGLSHTLRMGREAVVSVLNQAVRQTCIYGQIQNKLEGIDFTMAEFENSLRSFYRIDAAVLSKKAKAIDRCYRFGLLGDGMDSYRGPAGGANAWRAFNAVTQYHSREAANGDAALRSQLSGTRGAEPVQYLQHLAGGLGDAELIELVGAV